MSNDLLQFSTSQISRRVSPGLKSLAGRKVGIGAIRQALAAYAAEKSRYFFARMDRARAVVPNRGTKGWVSLVSALWKQGGHSRQRGGFELWNQINRMVADSQ